MSEKSKVKRLRIVAELEDGSKMVIMDERSSVTDLNYHIDYHYVTRYEGFRTEIEHTGTFGLDLKVLGKTKDPKKRKR